jgi:hypothetical protein
MLAQIAKLITYVPLNGDQVSALFTYDAALRACLTQPILISWNDNTKAITDSIME